jgi:ATP:cob(I)alamin adenosyltransferase
MGIYTKKGDSGMTDMLSGKRVSKDNPYIDLLGYIDEMTSYIGSVRVLLDSPYKEDIHRVQEKLIAIMGVISDEFQHDVKVSDELLFFERSIDRFQEFYPPQKVFVTPGDDEISVRLDIARTKVRQAERKLTLVKKDMTSYDDILKYLNRLSDYLYALARMLSFREKIRDAMKEASGGALDNNFEKINLVKRQEMTLDRAIIISRAVEEKAKSLACQVVICIVNNQGLPVLIHRMDQAFLISFNLAKKKAYTSAALKMPTHELGELTKAGADFEGLENMVDEDIVTLGGGYPIMYQDEIIGAIGVSGSTVANDSALAKYGARL